MKLSTLHVTQILMRIFPAFAGLALTCTELAQASDLVEKVSCYEMTLKETLGADGCSPVLVGIQRVNCSNTQEVTKKYRERMAQMECSESGRTLSAEFDGGHLKADVLKSKLWGADTFKIGKAQFVPKSSSDKNVPATPAVVKVFKPTPVAVMRKVASVHPVAVERKVASVPQMAVEPKIETVSPVTVERKTASLPSEETPSTDELKFQSSGMAWVELERSKNFGYDGDGEIPNFNGDKNHLLSSFFSNLNFSLSKSDTSLVSVLEVGEVVAGDEPSGGVVGGRQSVVELRNLYLEHQFSKEITFSAGLQSLSSDVNNFVLSDHYFSGKLQMNLSTFDANVWLAQAHDNPPGKSPEEESVNQDQNAGFHLDLKVSESWKPSFYGVYRRTVEELDQLNSDRKVSGDSHFSWLGTTQSLDLTSSVSLEGTYVLNYKRFRENSGSARDENYAHLADLRILMRSEESGFDVMAGALVTSGSKGNGSTLGRRKSFSSVGPSYLLTLATSDGVDDAPGMPKQSIIGDLNQSEGLGIYTLKVGQSFTPNLSAFVRFGYLNAMNSSSTGKTEMGQELDLQFNYQMSPDLALQADAAYFNPGAYYTERRPATLFTVRTKFSF